MQKQISQKIITEHKLLQTKPLRPTLSRQQPSTHISQFIQYISKLHQTLAKPKDWQTHAAHTG